ncbi:hypothetical protein [Gymnodinialimonas sp.]
MARNGGVEVGAQLRLVDLTFFTRARNARDLRCGRTTCRKVGPLPVTDATIHLSFGSGTFRN